MIGLFIAPLYYGLLILLLVKSIKYFKHRKKIPFTFFAVVSILILAIMPLTIVTGFLLPVGKAKRIFTQIGNYYFGISLYLLIGIGITELLRLLAKLILKKNYKDVLAKQISNICIVMFTIIMSVYGVANAQNLVVTKYDVTSKKESALQDLNIVLISDLHLGYNVGTKQMKNMVNKINALYPDIVVLAGDVFDNEWEAIKNPDELKSILSNIKSKYGNYAVYGNHDIEEKIFCGFTFKWGKDKDKVSSIKEMDDFIKDSGFTVLYDDYVVINNEDSQVISYIYGRPDYEKPNFGNATRLSPEEIVKGMDKDKYIICLDHEPRELQELADAGVDLDLNGHTHNGQVWPGTYTIKLFWDNAYGLKYFGDMANVVTSGVGLFGPNMRTGCKAEIAEIFVHFN